MTLSIHQATVPVFARGLGILSSLLRKGEAHTVAAGGDRNALLSSRLAPDMLPLTGQVQRASDTAKFAVSRLTGSEAPAFPDKETTFEELHQRIVQTVSFIETFDSVKFEEVEARTITLGSGDAARQFTADSYVLTYAIPNFFFHITTAYDILRHNGVAIGKRDYLWPAV